MGRAARRRFFGWVLAPKGRRNGFSGKGFFPAFHCLTKRMRRESQQGGRNKDFVGRHSAFPDRPDFAGEFTALFQLTQSVV
jgi:hypothetical protein